MSINPDELTKLDNNKNFAYSGKIYDLRSQLSLKRRNDVSSSLSKRQFINDLILNILAITSVFIVYFASEEFYHEKKETIDGVEKITKNRNESDSNVTMLRTINIFLTVALCMGYLVFFIYKHYTYDLRKMIARKLLSPEGIRYLDSLRSAGLLPKMFLEMIVMGLFCPPYFDYTFSGDMLNGHYTYSIEIIISIISMLRITQVVRIYSYFSIWMSSEAYDLGKKLNVAPTLWFSLKSDLKFQPQLVLIPTIGMIAMIMGYAVRNLERPYVSDSKSSLDFDYLTNGFWLAIVTMCTIGYGDGYPSTHLGRFIMVLTAAISLVAISLYIVALNIATILSKEQSKAFYMIRNRRRGIDYRNNASNVMKSVFALKRLMMHKDKPNYLRNLFVAAAILKKQLHYMSGKTASTSKYLSPTEMVMQLEHKLVSDINFIKKEIIDIDYIGDRLEELIKSEEEATKEIDLVISQHESVEKVISEMNLSQVLKTNKEN